MSESQKQASKYSPAEIEERWTQSWEEAKVYKSVPDDRPPYTITIPPPNVTGILHMGHVLNNTIQDVLIRRKRMMGFNTCWVPGTDHASIATEAKVVKLLADQGIHKKDIGREEFLKHAFAWKEKYGGIILQQLRKLGASCDWDRTHFTMDEEYSQSVLQAFCELHDKGYIYRGVRMVNWDPKAQTAVSDEEVNYKTTQGFLYHIRYKVEGMQRKYVTIATTRPETILGDTAVAVHPQDPRYKSLKGKRVIIPLVGRSIPIIRDEYVQMEFGTGCLKVTPAHDINDYELGIRHNLDSIDIFNDDGTINAAGKLYLGMDRMEVRKQIADDLEKEGFLVKREPYTHEVGYSERTNAAIEPRLSMQWFLKMKELSQPALQAVLEDDIRIYPDRFLNTYKHWMENVRDWCLSRQLWWGHRIPAYYIKDTRQYVVAMNPDEAARKARELTGYEYLEPADLEQDQDVLDTWASSWLWPISVFKGMTRPGNQDFAYYYPTNDLVTAPEILFFWVARMIIAGYFFTGKKPFSNVYLHGIVRDAQRRKMSKSLGNSPDPIDLIAEYGADAVRMGMLLSAPAGNDLLFDISLVDQGKKFANKVWNAYRLVSGWAAENKPATAGDQIACDWFDARIDQVRIELDDLFEKFRLSEALMSVYKLIWDDFCSSFLEMIKPPYGTPISNETLDRTTGFFERILQLLHPFMPFISEELWQNLRPRKQGEYLTLSQLPVPKPANMEILADMDLIQETLTALRSLRKEVNLPERQIVPLHVKTESEVIFRRNLPILEKMATVEPILFIQEKTDGTRGVQIRSHEFFLPAAQVDVAEEREKILGEIERTEGFLDSVMKKLGNEQFMSRAPENVVAVERKKKEDAEAKLKVLQESLSRLN